MPGADGRDAPPMDARLRQWLEYPYESQPTIGAAPGGFYFLSNRSGVPQAWKALGAGERPELLVPGSERVGSVQAAPEGGRVVVATDRGGNEHWQLGVYEDRPAAARSIHEWTSRPDRIHSPGAWRDGRRYLYASNERDVRFFDVYEKDVLSAAPARCLRQEDALLSVLAAQGDRALVARANTNLDLDLFLLRADGERHLNPHTGEDTVFSASLGRGDAWVASNADREFAALVRYRADGSFERVAEFAGDVEIVRCAPSGDTVALVVNEGGWSGLHLYDPRTSELSSLVGVPAGVIEAMAWSSDGRVLLFDLSSAREGQHVYGLDPATRAVRRWTESGRPWPGPVAAPALESFRAEDGLRVPFWRFEPTLPARGTVVWVHGGPESQARPKFNRAAAFLLGEGWRLVLPNVRGSSGYGRTYLHRDDVERRPDAVRDLRDLVRALVAGGDAGASRPVVLGGSYGGFMVLAALTSFPDLFAAGVDLVGIANFVTFLERTAPWRRKVRESEYGSLERDRELLRTISPLTHVDAIRVPLLVVHGANDPRVPVSEAEQIVEALRARKVPVEFVCFPDEGHDVTRLPNLLRTYAAVARFLERYGTADGPAKPPDVRPAYQPDESSPAGP